MNKKLNRYQPQEVTGYDTSYLIKLIQRKNNTWEKLRFKIWHEKSYKDKQ